MSDAVQILDAVAIVGDYLREHPDVESMVGGRVSHKSPSEGDFEEPWVRITLLDPQNVTGNSRVEWLVSYYLQIDCYAGSENRFAEAFDLAAAVRAALIALPDADLEDAVVTDIGFASMPSQPDADLMPARERFILDAEVFAHPR
ncbi:MAG TPA: DUF3168 domain-containing protein [Solirubrobacterales bacterium]|nr:DUF3168 domain-containing protein [Solirubrobacterales bacterium]